MIQFDINDYKIKDLVDGFYDDLPVNILDFKTCLKSDVSLDKTITMFDNGRPAKNQYFHNDILYAEIRFVFSDVNSLLTQRIEELYYIKNDGVTFSPKIVIKNRTYDHTDLTDGAIVVQERIDARNQIVASMKAFLSGVLMQALGQSMAQVVTTITPFWDETQADREHFIDLGTDAWQDALKAIDLTTTAYTYLSIPIDGNGTTARDYMAARLDY